MCVRRLKKILVVDDEPDIRTLLLIALRNKGYEVVTADDGDCALEIIDSANRSQTPFDVVILDWAMPRMGGLEVALKIRETHSSNHGDERPVRIEIFSGHNELDVPDAIKGRAEIYRTWDKTQINEMIDSL